MGDSINYGTTPPISVAQATPYDKSATDTMKQYLSPFKLTETEEQQTHRELVS
jgi:poly(A) polymerase Pap1